MFVIENEDGLRDHVPKRDHFSRLARLFYLKKISSHLFNICHKGSVLLDFIMTTNIFMYLNILSIIFISLLSLIINTRNVIGIKF